VPDRLALLQLEETNPVPRLLQQERGVNTWHRSDQEFGTPRAAFYFSVQSPVASKSPHELVATEIFVRMINEQLNRESYPAYLAGLHYDLYRHGRGFSVQVSGYADKQPVLLDAILRRIEALELDPRKLELVAAELKREWRNVALDSPSNQAVHEIYRLLIHPYWTETERLKVIDDIDVETVEKHIRTLLANANITVLSHGDVSAASSKSMTARLKKAFPGATLEQQVEPARLRALEPGSTPLRDMNIDHGDTALAIYYQGQGKSEEEWAKMALLVQLMEPDFYADLRTTHRVGYLVYATRLNILEVPGLLLSVQSPTHGASDIKALIDSFLAGFEDTLENLDEETFHRVKQGLISRILSKDKKLTDRTRRYWRQIDMQELDFDMREKRADRVKSLSREQLRSYFRQLIVDEPARLVVQSAGRRDGAALLALSGEAFSPVADAVEFRKQEFRLFPAM
jgi:secreted Zn-dependent insulinase-like peptidase